MEHVETDPESGAEIYRLVDDPRPADNIYGEQPYSSADGRTIAVRFFAANGRQGGLAVLDLADGSLETVLDTEPRFPAFHAWGDYLYFQEAVDGNLVLKRARYETGETESVTTLPAVDGAYSYGTVSRDHRYYAVCVEGDVNEVVVIDLENDDHAVVAAETEWKFKHEQFSRDGTNRFLVQANRLPAVDEVRLGVLDPDGATDVNWLSADRPHTPRPTGHEAWVGGSDRVLFSTADAGDDEGNLWIVGANEDEPDRVTDAPPHYSHVSVSRCGQYWIADAPDEPDVPIRVGSVETGAHRRIVRSGTVHGDEQWSHTHPYVTADNRWLIFNSTRAGHPQVFGARIPDGFLEGL